MEAILEAFRYEFMRNALLAGVLIAAALLGEVIRHPTVNYVATLPGKYGTPVAFLAELPGRGADAGGRVQHAAPEADRRFHIVKGLLCPQTVSKHLHCRDRMSERKVILLSEALEPVEEISEY